MFTMFIVVYITQLAFIYPVQYSLITLDTLNLGSKKFHIFEIIR